MATNRQIAKASEDFARESEILQALRDRRAELQTQLDEVNLRINDAQAQVASMKAELKTLVNE